VFNARKDAKMAHFTGVYGRFSPVCPVCGKTVMDLSGHAEYMVQLNDGIDPRRDGHVVLSVMES
jgi:hypothetical protein